MPPPGVQPAATRRIITNNLIAGDIPRDLARAAIESGEIDGAIAALVRNALVKNCRVHPTHRLISTQVAKRSAVPLCQYVHTGDMHRMLHDAHLRADGRGIDYSGVASELDVMKIIDRRLYDPITAQLRRALESGRGTAAALAEARRTKLTKHHPELSGLVEDVRRIH